LVLPGVRNEDELSRTAHDRVRAFGQLPVASQFGEGRENVAFAIGMEPAPVLHRLFNRGVRQDRISSHLLLEFRHLGRSERRTWDEGAGLALSKGAERKER